MNANPLVIIVGSRCSFVADDRDDDDGDDADDAETGPANDEQAAPSCRAKVRTCQ